MKNYVNKYMKTVAGKPAFICDGGYLALIGRNPQSSFGKVLFDEKPTSGEYVAFRLPSGGNDALLAGVKSVLSMKSKTHNPMLLIAQQHLTEAMDTFEEIRKLTGNK